MISNDNLNGNVGVYLRLSREDGDKLESDSIKNQRDLLFDFISSHKGLNFVKEYPDDGYSGTNFNRPSFQQMVEDAKRGKINCILVKDLSRFGRNYIETGRYLEKIFPLMGVRVIAVNDNYDSFDTSSDENQIVVPFKNLINDAYCRDISIKIRTHFDVKRRNGQYIGCFATYGYEKDPEDKNHLIIDEYAAEVVKLIFSMKLSGYGVDRIAAHLDQLGVNPPYEYKRQNGSKYCSGFRSSANPKWPIETVIHILKDETYTGTIVQGKSRKINYKVKKSVRIDENQWVRVRNKHDAIISKEQFDMVQEIMKKDTRTSPQNDTVYALSGYVKCGDCGQNMVRRTASKKGKKYFYYHCSTYKNGGDCTSHNISCQKVDEAVLDAMKKQIAVLDKIDAILETLDQYPGQQIGVKTLEKQLEKMKNDMEYYGMLKAKLYRDMVDGIVSKQDYIDLNASFEASRKDIEDNYHRVEHKRSEMLAGKIRFQPWIEEIKKYRAVTELSRPLVVSLIEKVTVISPEEIEVKFVFEDELAEVLSYIKAEQEMMVI